MSEGFKNKNRRTYTEESLKDTVRAMANRMTVRIASLTFGVPWMTIVRYERSPMAQKQGRPTKLDETEEALLMDMLMAFGNSGFPMNKHDLRSFVDEIGFGEDRKKAREWTVEYAEDWINLLSHLQIEGYLSDPSAILWMYESEVE
ncbi:hypothetical protein RvY_00216 [Ramazzottius varieornatus]|uniref:HTH psq-type domain-containing protein n=1 Tax=Ramazzottius varieornatus TaxID=947166 RepID=A0A1D1UC00_RAMVA|nr:hypothetical protein RvY_00216 [Ramazzottius varieornatus]